MRMDPSADINSTGADNAALRRRVAELEKKVTELTAQLAQQHHRQHLAALRGDQQRERSEELTRTRLRLYEFATTHSLDELLCETLDEAERLTESEIGFFHFIEADQQMVSLQVWSTRTTRDFCTASVDRRHYRVDEAGVWTDCMRLRAPVIHNDYASLPHKHGLPEGHAAVVRELVFPIFREDLIVALLGVGNKATDYTEEDVQTLSDLANAAWEVADRKRALEALRESQQRLDFAIRSTGAGVWDWEVRANRMTWDDHMLELYGITRDQFSGDVEAWKRGLHPDDQARARAECDEALLGERPFDTEFRVLRPDGTVRHVKADGLVLRDASGAAVRMIGLNRDVTERKRAEENSRTILAAMAEGVLLQDAEGRILSCNPAAARILGGSPDELIQTVSLEARCRPVREDGSAFPREEQPMGMTLRTGRSLRNVVMGVETPDRGRRWISIGTEPLRAGKDEKPYAVVATFADITERKRAEAEEQRLREALFHSQKMEAIGTLAGGVAHDFNNILGGLLSGLSLLELELGSARESCRADIQDMKDLVQRGADLARQLLGMSRRGKYDVQPLDLSLIVQKTSGMFGRTRTDVTIQPDLPADLPAVLMDHAQLEQVLLNLFVNAGQAMPAGGRITVRADTTTLTKEQAQAHGMGPGRFVQLVVSDTGTGMDAVTQARVFEPFFTTKGPGHGSGLGLASVYGILKNHGGGIAVKSEVGKGSEFTLFLPAASAAVSRKPPPAPATGEAQGTILVVDDETLLLNLCARLLRTMGYEVLTAPGGRAAVELVRRHHERLTLVILDLTMPDMSGAATYDAIREIAPGVKVLLSSGFSVEGQAQELLDRGCAGFIQKPFTAATLAEKIRSVQ